MPLKPLRYFFAFAAVLAGLHSPAQITVTLQLKDLPVQSPGAVYFAGSLNAWQPTDTTFRFSEKGLLTLHPAAATLMEYKLTRGSWATVECRANGADTGNRFVSITTDTVINVSVAAWKDGFQAIAPSHTASANVRVLDTAFNMPQLARSRTIRIYLPPGYAGSKKRYPVLYMHDGQNCFDESSAGFGEWQVDETLDKFYDSCRRSMIVVAVDHGGSRRLNEYNPYDHARFGPGEGRAYVDFLVNELKPYIDAGFRTLPSKRHTHIAGSSMGGLISLWAVMAYPAYFGSAGIFSPAFWTAPKLEVDIAGRLKKYSGKLFFYAGGLEDETMVPHLQTIISAIKKVSNAGILQVIDPEGHHNEKAWSVYFPRYLSFIL